ncbi:hypothetical protein J0X19_16675 [Hymenobacter sp. BT186]|uniref:DUF4138 domain-containing protein n=1 Tax=Hymenobacter telluris TaxID=2816474 RepID=A0A939EYN4_9BACT|nr:hypothetical protein [Hymenobacter telluris]MBO0359596.1 hypothetical protein [Hymenobacter telluris]MBW3375623.1 hypothetical protein [Hymenobacter norwichensis]
MRYSILWACLAGLGFTSCGASTFLALRPAQPDGSSVNGHPTSTKYQTEDSVEVRLSFVRYDATELVFEVEIGNDSKRPVLIEPTSFFYAPIDTTVAPRPGAQPMLPRIAAIDPETRLKNLAANLETEATKAEKVSWFEIATTVTQVAESVASIKKKETDAQIAEREERHASTNAYFANQREQHAQNADDLYNQHQNAQSVMLRSARLPSGEYVSGQVNFPRTDTARRLRFVLFYNERPVTFDFNQTLEKVSYTPTGEIVQAH